MTLDIIHEGPGYVAIHKPAGIAVEAFRDHDTVEARAWAHFQRPRSPKRPFVGIIHRLDRPVSGILLLARNKSTLRYFNRLFAERRMEKVYRARTQVPGDGGARSPLGRVVGDRGMLRDFLARDERGRRAIIAPAETNGAKLAELRYECRRAEGRVLDYRLWPRTGRYHQIRVQLAAAGAPIIGDVKYGSATPYRANAIMLHAEQLCFVTKEGERVRLRLPAPFSENEV